jgi:ubiquinone/menaquinone biosynthesis C-methylase UbiE
LIGGVDIYLLDQIIKNRFPRGTRILDAGCGGGRNISWFLRSGYDVSGVDSSEVSITSLQKHVAAMAPQLPAGNFRVEPVEHMSFADETFDAVLSIAVLHFARHPEHFEAMLREMWRVLRPGGVCFARLGSTVGIEDRVLPLENGRFAVPDGSTRYLVSMDMLVRLTNDLGARLLEPIKTVNVQNMRCMTTWVVGK